MNTLVEMRKSLASGLLAVTVLAGAAALLSACNTARGFGEDMRAAGGAISNSAQKTQEQVR